jgi:nitroreductase
MSTAKPVARPLSALDVIFSRRSVRSYTAQTLDHDTVRALLDAAVQAPTALHAEPWAFVVVQDARALKRYSDVAKALWATELGRSRDLQAIGEAAMRSHFAEAMANPEFSVFYDAGTLIVICAKPLGSFVTADCWLAAENLMLAACAMGLGSCCIGSAVGALNTPDVKAELGIPADVVAVAPIIVGVPREAAASDSRKAPEILGWLHAEHRAR